MFGGGGAGGKPTKIKEGGEKGRWGEEKKKFEIWVEARVFTGFLKPGYSIIHLMLRAAARQYGNRVFFFFFLIVLSGVVARKVCHNPAFCQRKCRILFSSRPKRIENPCRGLGGGWEGGSRLLSVLIPKGSFSSHRLSKLALQSSAFFCPLQTFAGTTTTQPGVFKLRSSRTTCSLLRKNVQHVNNY